MEPALPPRDPHTEPPVDDLYDDVYDDFVDETGMDGPEKRKRSRTAPILPEGTRPKRWPIYMVLGCLGCPLVCCVLLACSLVIAGAGVAAILSNSEVTESGTTRVDIAPDTVLDLSVTNRVGAVTIRPGAEDVVVVEYTKKAYGWSKGSARAELDHITVDVQQPSDQEVTIKVDTERVNDSFWFFANQVHMTVTVPRELFLTIETNVGLIDVADVLAHSLMLSTDVGEVRFSGDLDSAASQPFRIESSTGAINVRLARSAYVALDAKSDVGSVNVEPNFASVDAEFVAPDGVGDSWLGTLGSGRGDPPQLILRADTGAINVEPR